MKTRKKEIRSRQGVSPKIQLIILLALACSTLGILVMFWVTRLHPSNKRSVDSHAHILSKLSRTTPESRFTPVLLYLKVDNGRGSFLGSGSLFRGDAGEQIVTSEHLVRRELGTELITFRVLRPFETKITRCIESVLHQGAGLSLSPGQIPDVVLLKVGQLRSIEGFADRSLIIDNERAAIRRLPEPEIVQSLVSGEKVSIIGLVQSHHDNGTHYVLMEYPSVSGESGTGFINAADDLYVLKGHPQLTSKKKAMIQKFLGTSKELSIAYGPLRFRS